MNILKSGTKKRGSKAKKEEMVKLQASTASDVENTEKKAVVGEGDSQKENSEVKEKDSEKVVQEVVSVSELEQYQEQLKRLTAEVAHIARLVDRAEERANRPANATVLQLELLTKELRENKEALEKSNQTFITETYQKLSKGGREYSKELFSNLKPTFIEVQRSLDDSKSALQLIRTVGNRLMLGILVFLIAQSFVGYRLYSEIQSNAKQIQSVHDLYEGDSKYWFDTNNQQLWIKSVKTQQGGGK